MRWGTTSFGLARLVSLLGGLSVVAGLWLPASGDAAASHWGNLDDLARAIVPVSAALLIVAAFRPAGFRAADLGGAVLGGLGAAGVVALVAARLAGGIPGDSIASLAGGALLSGGALAVTLAVGFDLVGALRGRSDEGVEAEHPAGFSGRSEDPRETVAGAVHGPQVPST